MTKKRVSESIIVAAIYLLFALLLWPFKTPLLFAALFAFALHPLAIKMLKFKKIHWKNLNLGYYTSVSVLLLTFMTVIVVPFIMMCARLVSSLKGLDKEDIANHPTFQKFTQFINQIYTYVLDKAQDFGISLKGGTDIKATLSQYGKIAASKLTAFVANIPEFLFDLILFVVLIYFFLKIRQQISRWILRRSILNAQQLAKVSKILQDICSTVLVSSVLIALIQSSIITMAAKFAGFDEGIIIFMACFFLSFIPMIGNVPITLGLVIYSFANGDATAAIILIVAGAVAGTIDNIIRSWIFSSGESEINPIISFLTIIGSLAVFGVSGLFLGPLITELTFKVDDIFLDHD